MYIVIFYQERSHHIYAMKRQILRERRKKEAIDDDFQIV